MIKVLCVGDSITEGCCSTNPDIRSYPAQLNRFLGNAYEVKNFGYGGRTLMTDSDWPYVKDPAYAQSLAYPADIVIIMLGTNDTRDYNFERIDKFTDDMTAFIESYQSMPSSPKVYVVTSPKIFQTEELAERCLKINEFQRIAAKRTGCPIIEFAQRSLTMADEFPDGLHPNDTGYVTLAEYFYENIFGGTLYDCTVKTVPNAAVDFYGQTHFADEEGLTSFRLPFGSAPLTIRLSGYATIRKTVNITGNTEILAPMAAGAKNISQSCVTVATSVEGDFIPENAVDGNLRTRWASADEGNEQTITVDLGAEREISGFIINWEIAYAKGYNITVSSDGENETEIYSTNEGHGAFEEIILDTPAFGRYVSLNMTEKGTVFGYSLWEFEVYGSVPTYIEPEFTVTYLTETEPEKAVEKAEDIDGTVDDVTHVFIKNEDCDEAFEKNAKCKNTKKKSVKISILGTALAVAGTAIGVVLVKKLIKKRKGKK